MLALAYQAFGLAEAEQIDVEALAGLKVRLPQCKMAKQSP